MAFGADPCFGAENVGIPTHLAPKERFAPAYAGAVTDAIAGGVPVEAGFDPLAPAFLADPMAALASLPDGVPVFYAPAIEYFVVTRYDDVEAVFRDPETFSAAAAQLPMTPLTPEAQQTLLDGGHRPQPSMVSLDPPDHERLRGPAARAFTPARVTAMEGPVRTRTRTLLDAIAGETTFELVATIAFPLPALTIFDMLGVPEADIPQLKEWCGARALLTFGRPAPEHHLTFTREYINISSLILSIKVPDILKQFVQEAKYCYAFEQYLAVYSLCRTILESSIRDMCIKKGKIKRDTNNVIDLKKYRIYEDMINKVLDGNLRETIIDIYGKTSFLIHGHKTIGRSEALEMFNKTIRTVQDFYKSHGF